MDRTAGASPPGPAAHHENIGVEYLIARPAKAF